MSVTFSNATFGAAQSTTGAYVGGSFTGTNTLSGVTPVTVNGTADTPGSTVQLTLNIGGVTYAGVQGTYLGYTAVPNSQDNVYYFSATGGNLVTPVNIGVTPAAALPALNVATPVTTTNVTAPASASPICFATGTRIRTEKGDVLVEHLSVGDTVVTAKGEARPIVWIGRRRTDCSSHVNPVEVLPVRIRAGAFGPSLPYADLLVSPGHRLFVNGALVPADMLVNGRTIVREMVDEITYWHVELETHDVLLAAGLPAESFIDAGNRASFEENGGLILLQPDLDALGREEGRCAPVIGEGAELAAIKSWLLDRAAKAGARYTRDPSFAVSLGDQRLTPVSVENGRFRFVLEAPASVTLSSLVCAPSEVRADCDDRRALGVLIHSLEIDGRPVAMDGSGFADGWHAPETTDSGRGRWTKGDAALPAGREIAFSTIYQPVYAIEPARKVLPFETRTERRLRAVG